jgi:hypothetical protein
VTPAQIAALMEAAVQLFNLVEQIKAQTVATSAATWDSVSKDYAASVAAYNAATAAK